VKVGVVGQSADDHVRHPDGRRKRRVGGAPVYSARALRFAGFEPVVLAKGVPIPDARMLPARRAFVSHLHLHADGLEQTIGACGDPFTPAEATDVLVPALAGCRWVLLGTQTAGDFPPETIAALAGAGYELLLDGQGPARGDEPGPVRLRPFAPSAVAGVTALKLNHHEATAALGTLEPARLAALGVPEVLVTRGHLSALVVVEGDVDEVPAGAPRFADPTGAGDSWAALYAAARSRGDVPVAAARFAAATVERLYSGSTGDQGSV
jgi:hypothetical protein